MRRRLLTRAAATAATVLALLCGNTATASAAGTDIGIDLNLVDVEVVSVLNVDACGNDIAMIGVIAAVLSPESSNCINNPEVESHGYHDSP